MTSVLTGAAADAALEEAQRTGYRYPPEFRGFTAVMALDDDGGGAGESRVSVSVEDAGVSVEGSSGADPWALEQIRSMVSHRLGRAYEAGDGRFPKRLVEHEGPLGALIEVDDGMRSSYRVSHGQITLVTRRPGGTRFSIAVQERTEAGAGAFLPQAFTVFYWDAEGALVASEAFSDRYVDVGSLLLPASRRVVRADRNGVTARWVTLREHSFGEGAGQ